MTKRSRQRPTLIRAYLGGLIDVALITALRARCAETGEYASEVMENALRRELARGGKRRREG